MILSLFESRNYRSYLKARATERGARTRWAEIMGCQKGYLTRVLREEADLSLEQIFALARHWSLDSLEQEYLLLMLQRDRAGSLELRAHFEERLAEVRSRRLQTKHRIKGTQTLSPLEQLEFYSDWSFAAVHIALLLPSMRSAEKLATTLRLPLSRVHEILQFLERARMLDDQGHPLFPRSTLAGGSPLSTQNHRNWRVRILQALQSPAAQDLHYSSVLSVARADRERVSDLLLKALEQIKEIVRDSRDEDEVQVLCLDFVKLV